MPVLHDTLDRSFQLRGGDGLARLRPHGVGSAEVRRTTTALLLAGLLGLCCGLYGVLDASTPRLLGAPMLGAGIALAAAGLMLGGRRVHRTRYRPDPWAFPEWATALSGVAAAVGMIVAGSQSTARAQSLDLPAGVAHAPVAPRRGHPARAASRGAHAAPADRARSPLRALGNAATHADRVTRRPHRSERVIRFEHVTITYPDAGAADAPRREPRRFPRASCAS